MSYFDFHKNPNDNYDYKSLNGFAFNSNNKFEKKNKTKLSKIWVRLVLRFKHLKIKQGINLDSINLIICLFYFANELIKT